MSRTRYQQGSIRRVARKGGPDVWVFRWRNTDADGSKKENNRVIGTVLEYRTKAAAERAADPLRININSTTPRASIQGMTFGKLAEHYVAREFDVDQQEARSPKAHSTIEGNRRNLRLHILPRWEKTPIQEMEPILIEDWFAKMGRGPDKLSPGTLKKLRSVMSTIFRHGIRHGFLPRDEHANPMKYVRQSDSSDKEHTILTQNEVMAIHSHLKEPVRTMVLLDAATGLRASELLGLRWSDIDFALGIVHVQRGIVYGVVGKTKNKGSQSRLPLAAAVLEALNEWRCETPYAAPEDWVFASPRMKGRKPYRGNTLVSKHLRVAAKAVGVEGTVGFHTFRRSISTWLIDNDENVKVTQELMRHSNSKTTLDIYAKAATPSKRLAHGRIVDGLVAHSKANDFDGTVGNGTEYAFVG